jgi:hypothetical protein
MTISVLQVNPTAFTSVRIEEYLVGPDVTGAVGVACSKLAAITVSGCHLI